MTFTGTQCLFCAIAHGDAPADFVREDPDTVTFRDVDPQAPIHLLVIPRRHFPTIVELAADPAAGAALLRAIRTAAESLGLDHFRTVFNTGRAGGQHIWHVHAHILSGRPMSWPPG